jgi:HK97 family phage major capsid protein
MDAKQLNKRKSEILDAKEAVLKSKMEAHVGLSDAEKSQFTAYNNELESIDLKLTEIKNIEKSRAEINTPRESVVVTNTNQGHSKFYAMGGTHKFSAQAYATSDPTPLSNEYAKRLWASLKNGKTGFDQFCIQNAALGEGGTTADGSALVPIQTDPTIPNLAPYESSARKLSRVITTEMDINLPYQSAKAAAAIKAESNNSGTNAFATNVPQFATTKLSAFMVGDSVAVSWELLQDSKALAAFVTEELQRVQLAEEENLFISGNGTSQPQGYLGNASTPTGANITAGVGSIGSNGIKPILETVASLNPNYYGNASFLVHRQEFVRLQEAQLATSQFQTYVTWDANGQARLLGHPVLFSFEMPVYSASPSVDGVWLFGDFRAFATIGDRGDSNIRIKVLDQVAALNGQTVVLGYRRTDQRIILAEAVMELQTNG